VEWAAAGVTKGAAYHHFGGKAELFRAAFVRRQEQIATALERAGMLLARSADPALALPGVATEAAHLLAALTQPGSRTRPS
jgi:AcrR family transcriptional regulator